MSDLPNGWEIARVEDIVVQIVGGGTPSKSNPAHFTGQIPFMTVKDLTARFPTDTVDHISQEAIESSATSLVPADTLIVATRMAVGKVVRPQFATAINQDLKALFIAEGINKTFLEHWWRSRAKLIQTMGTGTTVQGIRLENIRSLSIAIPPLNEQRRIADKLDVVLARVDACHERLDRVPAILKRFRQSVLAAATSGKLTKEWTYYRSGTKRDQSGYPMRQISELVTEPLRNGRSVRNGKGTPVLRLSALQAGHVDITVAKRGDWAGIDFTRFLIKPGDFLVARGNGSRDLVGRGGLVTQPHFDVAFPDTMIRIRFDATKVLPRYVRLIWDTAAVRDEIELTARTTAGIWKIAQPDLERLELPIPCINEQVEIVRRIETLFAYADRLESRYLAARNHVERLTPMLLAKAFRGELVPQDPNDEPASVLLERIRAARAAEPARPRQGRSGSRPDKLQKPEVRMLNREEVQDTHLTEILKAHGPLTAEELWSESQLSIDDFYDQLKDEEARGLLKERRAESLNTPRKLEAAA